MKNAIDNNTSLLSAAGRVLLATIFIFSALGKIAAPAATMAVELGGGLMLVLGVKARWVAAALAAFSIVTGLAFHNALGDQNQLIHLLKNFAMAGGLLQVAAFGAGAFSIDGRTSRPAIRQAA
jgi:putative oxidoreductase